MQLTHDQEAATAAFIAFANNPDAREMVISGPAGTGKTTLLKHFIKMKDHYNVASLLGTSLPKTWYLTATTNKAAEVLYQATGKETSTIHSLLGLQLWNDYETGRQRIKRRKNSEIIEDAFIVVDECSMVDFELRKLIGECTLNCKILYLGDHCQMAPVFEDLSPVFADNPLVELKKIVRSKNTPEITSLANQLRQTVETGVFQPIQPVPGVIEFLDPAMAELRIQDDFVLQSRTDVRILAYTNRQVQALNQYLRTQRNLPDHITDGEQLIANNAAISLSGQRLSIEKEVEVLVSYHHRPSTFEGLDVYEVDTTAGTFLVPVDFANWQYQLNQAAKAKNWPRYFNLKDRIADLRPRDACTVYKAQGSTYRDVYVHLSDIGSCTNAAQAARMLYVACSRPTHRINFIGKLPPRFQGE